MSSEANPPPPTVSAAPLPDLESLTLALSNPIRWRMLEELAKGEQRTIGELAGVGGCGYDSGMRHLALMRDAGMVEQGRGSLYQMPARFIPVPGQPVLDFGHCLLRFKAGK